MMYGIGILILTLACFVQGSRHTGQVLGVWLCYSSGCCRHRKQSEGGDWVDGWVMVMDNPHSGRGCWRREKIRKNWRSRTQDINRVLREACMCLRAVWRWLVLVIGSCHCQDETSASFHHQCGPEGHLESDFINSGEMCLGSIQTLKLSFGTFFYSVMTLEFEQAMPCGGLLTKFRNFPKI